MYTSPLKVQHHFMWNKHISNRKDPETTTERMEHGGLSPVDKGV